MSTPINWEKVKFGEVVSKINDKVPNRDEWNFDRFIGGEHFDEGEIRVTRSAPIVGNEEVIGSAFHMRFKPGQVLYVTRNPRLRKGGIVNFEGVCSNVSFVMEADEKHLLQSLLPFIIQTEDFVKHTTNNAHGSTNPFLNWKDIAKYEFLLPTLEEQKKVDDVLWSIEEVHKKITENINFLIMLRKKLLNKFIGIRLGTKYICNKEIENKIMSNSLNRFYEIINVNPARKLAKSTLAKCITMADLTAWSPKITSWQEKKYVGSGSKFQNGDTIFARITPCLENGKTAYIDILKSGEVAWGSTEFIIFSGKNDISDNEFVYYVGITPFLRKIAIDWMIGTSGRQRVPNKVFEKIYFDIPTLNEQQHIINKLKSLDNQIVKCLKYKQTLISLRNKLSNELFSGNLRLE